MEDQKAPGPNGFLAIFYKRYWDVVGKAITQAVTSFFVEGSMPKEINSSLIVLIPKSQSPSTINNFRPINVCNVLYKIISKLPLLHKLISPTQSAFIPERWIAKNQVIVQEMLHNFMNRKMKSGLMAIKLDLQKAYNRLNWSFLK